jgi:hypothetical protein
MVDIRPLVVKRSICMGLLRRAVHTGLAGRRDFRVQWTPDESQFGGMVLPSSSNPNASPGLFTAIQEAGWAEAGID